MFGSVAEKVQAESLADVPDAALEEDLDELHRACERLEGRRLARIAEVDRRRLFERDGYLSCAAWLVNRYRMAWGEARAKVRMACALEQMPLAQEAFEDGEISLGAVRVLSEAQHAHPEAFAEGEERLVEAARLHSVSDLQRVAAFWG